MERHLGRYGGTHSLIRFGRLAITAEQMAGLRVVDAGRGPPNVTQPLPRSKAPRVPCGAFSLGRQPRLA